MEEAPFARHDLNVRRLIISGDLATTCRQEDIIVYLFILLAFKIVSQNSTLLIIIPQLKLSPNYPKTYHFLACEIETFYFLGIFFFLISFHSPRRHDYCVNNPGMGAIHLLN